ncbi:low-density lipoprotein receptor-related protein 6-like [Saccostrea echinata]|uniref:low-density lipoprotein receptor-related protein 6-like n=1 Tax=Saccostrea echinata TaxID=191078 RepID=UPI002A83A4B5|nr:low-density lipoprotein receptor-related protein 6-like [Saccostrea echinata]
MFLKYDTTSQRLFWLESGLLVKSSLPNGTDIKSHIIASRATDLFIYKDFIGWLSGEEIHFSSKTSSASEVYFNIFPNPMEVGVFDPTLQDDLRGTCKILNGRCDDICIPSETESKCGCDIGLQLQADQKSCDSNIQNTDFIIVSDFTHGRILQINFNTEEIVKLPINVQHTSGITLDKMTKEIIHSNSISRTVQVFSLQGKQSTLTTVTGFAYAERMAVDQSTGNIYFTAISSQPNSSYVGVLHRTQLVHKILIHDLQNPRAIVLYSAKGILFWTETLEVSKIGRAFMDGTSKEYIVTISGGFLNGLALDFETDRLYWTDGQRNTIEYSDLDGRNQRVLMTDKDAQLVDIVLNGQFLYYTAWNRQRITKIDKTKGTEVPFMKNHPELGRLDSIDIYSNDIIDGN